MIRTCASRGKVIETRVKIWKSSLGIMSVDGLHCL